MTDRTPAATTTPPRTASGGNPAPGDDLRHGRRRPSRVVVEDVWPSIDGGRHPTKAVIGDEIAISADVFADGHDRVAAALVVTPPSGSPTRRLRMVATGDDRWQTTFRPDRLGLWDVKVVGWVDRWSTWCDGAVVKRDAGVLTDVDVEIGRRLLLDAAGGDHAERLRWAAERLDEGDLGGVVADALVDDAMWATSRSGPEAGTDRSHPVDVDRERAEFSAWYELFPRSFGPDGRHGTLADVGPQLERIAAMGFDVVYLPPIHPIGATGRKGPDNRPEAGPDDVGSPWAIGGRAGGHTAVHPDLGSLDAVDALVAQARRLDLEVAMDLAFQCSPDHPWVTRHPQWFRSRPDGTIQYAENPPKKYEDIYPIDFDTDDWAQLWEALGDVVRFWIDHGVRIFRVDNPHTKQLAFWEWLLAEVRRTDPDVLFLAEAFTRPKVMYHLAKVGFDQSYTYFTWRTTAHELAEYCRELTTPPVSWYFRPNFWPNAPDILAPPLQYGDRAAFVSRAVLAATLSSSWGVYGPAFELQENLPRHDAEEYAGNEKYQLVSWELDRPGSLAPLLARLNEIRRHHPSFRRNSALHVHQTDNPGLLAYSRTHGTDRILCVVATDTHLPQEGTVDLDLAALGLGEDRRFVATDLLGGGRWTWHGRRNEIRVEPGVVPAHIFSLRPDTSKGDLP